MSKDQVNFSLKVKRFVDSLPKDLLEQPVKTVYKDGFKDDILPSDLYKNTGQDIQRVAGQINKSVIVSPIWRGRDFTGSKDLCFVLMPFGASWSSRIWKRHLKPIIENCGLRAQRADDFTGHDIMEDVWEGLNKAQVVVADITGKNPNVYYELGIAHTLGKSVILITQNLSDVPFDVNRYRVIEYEDNSDGYDKLRTQLTRFLSALLSEPRSLKSDAA